MADLELSSSAALPGQVLCASGELEESGKAWTFEVQRGLERIPAFVLRFQGQVVGYLNRCAHIPAEMDWQIGHFLDADRQFILCSIHGASYEPLTGRCAGGPCGRGRLQALTVRESDGVVTWYPSDDLLPVPAAAPSGAAPAI